VTWHAICPGRGDLASCTQVVSALPCHTPSEGRVSKVRGLPGDEEAVYRTTVKTNVGDPTLPAICQMGMKYANDRR